MTFRRLGGTRDLSVDVRIVAATNKELADEVERGRVPAGPVSPPRRLPHPPAAAARSARGHPAARGAFLASSRRACGSRRCASRPRPSGCSPAYDYPGNVRELRNVIERAVILSSGEVIGPGASCSRDPTRALPGRRDSSPPSWTGAGEPRPGRAGARVHRPAARVRGRQPHAGRPPARRLVPDRREKDRRLRPRLSRPRLSSGVETFS